MSNVIKLTYKKLSYIIIIAFFLCLFISWCLTMLTKQEKQLIYLILHGYSNPKIASIFKCSLSTIKTKIRIIFAKCNVNCRIQLARKYYEDPDFFINTAKNFQPFKSTLLDTDLSLQNNL